MAWLRSLRRKAQAWVQLPLADRLRLLAALALLPGVAMSVRLAGLRRTCRRLSRLGLDPKPYGLSKAGQRSSLSPRCSRRDLEIRERAEWEPALLATARIVRIAARFYGGWINCLPRSLVLWLLLRRQGIAAELRIGARRHDGQFEAHAWIECGGAVLNESPEVHRTFAAFPADIAMAVP